MLRYVCRGKAFFFQRDNLRFDRKSQRILLCDDKYSCLLGGLLSTAMLRQCLAVLAAVLAVLIGRFVVHFEVFKKLEEFPTFQKSQDQCRPVGSTASGSCEDFRFISDNILIAGFESVNLALDFGNDAPHSKHMVAVDLTTEKHRLIDLEGFPFDQYQFRPHGIDYKAPDRLFVVNHANDGVERVEVFEVSGQGALDTVKLKWIKAVTPPVPKLAMNSVTAVSPNEIYVTHWLPVDIPKGGMGHPKTPPEIANVVYNYGLLLGGRALGLPHFVGGKTSVYRCLVDKNQCELAFPGFVSSNGITSTPDGKFVFVVDCVRQFLAVFKRDTDTGKLTLAKSIDMIHTGDNIMVGSAKNGKYELWVGTIPDLNKYLAKNKMLPGGLILITFDPRDLSLVVKDEFLHDGSKLEGVATAAKWRGKVLLGSPKKGGGILICEPNKP